MSNDIYAGPVIDAHHHLWDLSLDRHPWLTRTEAGIGALGDIGYMRHDYLPADYLRDAGQTNLVGSVCIEAVWDRTRSPVEETAWLAALPRPGNVARRCIAYAPLASPEAARILDEHAAYPIVAGVRETIRWHPDPARRWTEAGLAATPEFRRGVRLLRRHGFVLELLMNPYQAEEAAELARAFPDQPILVNHCGTPVDRDEAGLARWRDGLARMAQCPNISIKVSNFGAYDPDRSLPRLRRTVMTCVEAFGTGRAMFGTDYPVAKRNMGYGAMVEAFGRIVAGFSEGEQRALFWGNAARVYRFPE
ncbi:MAG TPA: amidohydrolase family protein [Acetobacteraceae bacterium]